MAMERIRQTLMHKDDDAAFRSPKSAVAHRPSHIALIPPFTSTPGLRRASDPTLSIATPRSVSGQSSRSLQGTTTTVNPASKERHTKDVPAVSMSSPRADHPETLSPRITTSGWDISKMCDTYSNFRRVHRVSALAHADKLSRALEEYDSTGEPMIIEDWHKHPEWCGDILNTEWLLANAGHKDINVRNVHDHHDYPLTLSEFVVASRAQHVHHVPGESQRLYWKDADCPDEWRDWIKKVLPSQLLPGCRDDLLRHLDTSETVESLLCYLGIGDTFTAAHKDLCASSGHNLMCFSENGGSSFWFMTQTKDAPGAAAYFQQKLGHELDWEIRVTTIEELANAPFKVYVTEQKVGDLVLVPPQSVHQVVNHGGLAMKISWSRMTVENLKVALQTELPIYHRHGVCRPEQYRVKTILYRSVLHYMGQLEVTSQSPSEDVVGGPVDGLAGVLGGYTPSMETSSEPEPLLNDAIKAASEKLWTLLKLFDDVLCEEYAFCHADLEHVLKDEFDADQSLAKSPTRHGYLPHQSHESRDKEHSGSCNFACDFCGADIFQSFFECRACRETEDRSDLRLGDGLLLCASCYTEGRTCSCEVMQPAQCRPFEVLLRDRNRAMKVLCQVAPQVVGREDKFQEIMEESDIRKSRHLRVFEAACALRKYRIANRDRLRTDRRCRTRTFHDMNWLASLNCSGCHNARCFPHLLSQGTHSAQAFLTYVEQKDSFHEMHMANADELKRTPFLPHNPSGSLMRRLVAAAISFPDCRPGHSNVKLGWYDKGNLYDKANTPPRVDTRNLRSQSIERDMSPLTPIEGGSAESSPEKHPHSSYKQRSAATAAAPASTSRAAATDFAEDHEALRARALLRRCYVQVQPLRTVKRPASSPLQIPLAKKPHSATSEESNRRSSKPAMIRLSVRDTSPSNELTADYSQELVSAFTKASQNGAPIFTQDAPQRSPGSRHKRAAVRRIVGSDEEKEPSPSRAPSTSVPLSLAVAAQQHASAVPGLQDRASAAPMLPRVKTLGLQGTPTPSTARRATTFKPALLPRSRKRKRARTSFEGDSEDVEGILVASDDNRNSVSRPITDPQALGLAPPAPPPLTMAASTSTSNIPEVSISSHVRELNASGTSGSVAMYYSPSSLDMDHPFEHLGSNPPLPNSSQLPVPLASGMSSLVVSHVGKTPEMVLRESVLRSFNRYEMAKLEEAQGQRVVDVIDTITGLMEKTKSLEAEITMLRATVDENQAEIRELKELRGLREQYLDGKIKNLEEAQKNERAERNLMSASIRDLEKRADSSPNDDALFEKFKPIAEKMCQDAMSSMMPRIRESLMTMVGNTVQLPPSGPTMMVSPIEQQRAPDGGGYGSTVENRYLLPMADEPRPPFEGGRQYRQENRNGYDQNGAYGGNMHMRGRGGPFRGSFDRNSDQRPPYQDRPHYRGGPDRGRGGFYPQRGHEYHSHNRPRPFGGRGNRAQSRPRSRSPGSMRGRTSNRDLSPRPSLHQASWDPKPDRTSSTGQFDDEDRIGIPKSATDMSLSPIDTSSTFDSTRPSRSEISSFTEKDARDRPSSIRLNHSNSSSQSTRYTDVRPSATS